MAGVASLPCSCGFSAIAVELLHHGRQRSSRGSAERADARILIHHADQQRAEPDTRSPVGGELQRPLGAATALCLAETSHDRHRRGPGCCPAQEDDRRGTRNAEGRAIELDRHAERDPDLVEGDRGIDEDPVRKASKRLVRHGHQVAVRADVHGGPMDPLDNPLAACPELVEDRVADPGCGESSLRECARRDLDHRFRTLHRTAC